MTVLKLSAAHVEVLRREAEAAFPRECCGLLIGQGVRTVTVTDVVVSENHANSDDRFLIDPQAQFDWMRKLRGTDRRIIGHYHSHPNGQDEPSKHDADMARDSGQIWVIVPVNKGRSGSICAFEAKAKSGSFLSVLVQSI